MTRFIALTETPSNKTVLINVKAIVYVQKGQKEDADTYVRVNSGASEGDKGSRNFYFFVKEPVDTIHQMLVTDNTQPPIMMNAEEYSSYRDQLDRSHMTADSYLPDDGRHRA